MRGVCPDDDRGAAKGGGDGDPNWGAVISGGLDACETPRHVGCWSRPNATGDRHFAVRGVRTGVSTDPVAARDALEAALADLDGDPECMVCPAPADFFLYEADRVAKFVCWEHVSPVSAAVDADPDDADRPIALRLE